MAQGYQPDFGGEMATCKRCSRTGFFMAVDHGGLCKTCSAGLNFEAVSIHRVVGESLELIKTSKNLDTRLSRCDTILSFEPRIVELDRYGKWTVNKAQTARQFLSALRAHKSHLIEVALEEEVEAASSKAATLATVASKVNALSKVLLRVESFQSHPDVPPSLPALKERVQGAILKIQLESHLEAARKAEFKNQKKKALDSYYEALYLLRHDEVDDALQADQIRPIEEKVLSLGGTVA